jgi:hypothetical protein
MSNKFTLRDHKRWCDRVVHQRNHASVRLKHLRIKFGLTHPKIGHEGAKFDDVHVADRDSFVT